MPWLFSIFSHPHAPLQRPALPVLAMAGMLALWLFSGFTSPALAAPAGPKNNEPVLFSAEEMGYDQRNATVVALGKVEVVQGDYVLLADRLTYNQNTDIVTASGNVSVLEPNGNVYFAEEVQLRRNLQKGVVEYFRARLSDNSLFSAREAKKISESVTELNKATYSPCKLCKNSDPLWQLKAEHVTVDEEAQQISYRNAFFEVYGVPIIYTPYFAHATPGADNKTGLLTPEFTRSSTLGSVLRVPYFISIAPDKDLTLTPIFTSDEGPVLLTEYRQKFDNGQVRVEASGTNPDQRDADGSRISGKEFRGHLRAKGDFNFAEYWGAGFDVNRASDDTYLRRYGFGNEDLLTTRAYVERIQDRSYAGVQTLAFQGLRVDDVPARSPLIAPLFDVAYETAPMFANSRFSVSGNALALTRDEGAESRRASVTSGWRVPVVTRGGQVIEARAEVRADGYDVSNLASPGANGGPAQSFDGSTERVIPQASVTWRYPFLKRLSQESSLILEPTIMAVVAPKGGNASTIPNEDSLSTEFSDSNLFRTWRYAGYDLVENGSRIAYGLRGQWQVAQARDFHFLVGQNYNVEKDNALTRPRDADEHFSDYVGRVAFTSPNGDVSYRFLLDQKDMSLRRSEVNGNYRFYPFTLDGNYIRLNNDPILDDREELAAASSVALNPNWSVILGGRRNLDEGRMIDASSGLIFQNECVTVVSGVTRTFTRDRDIEPSTSFTVRVGLKNLE